MERIVNCGYFQNQRGVYNWVIKSAYFHSQLYSFLGNKEMKPTRYDINITLSKITFRSNERKIHWIKVIYLSRIVLFSLFVLYFVDIVWCHHHRCRRCILTYVHVLVVLAVCVIKVRILCGTKTKASAQSSLVQYPATTYHFEEIKTKWNEKQMVNMTVKHTYIGTW